MVLERREITFADQALQGVVLACVIDNAPVPVEELAVLLFEGHFSPGEEAEVKRAVSWLVEAQLLRREGDLLKPVSPPTGLGRTDGLA